MELVEILKEMYLPLTKSHVNIQKYMIDPDTHINIAPTYIQFFHMTYTNQHLEISIRPQGKAMISLYSDFNESGMDQLIIDTVDFFNNRLSQQAMLKILKSEKERINSKIKLLENGEETNSSPETGTSL